MNLSSSASLPGAPGACGEPATGAWAPSPWCNSPGKRVLDVTLTVLLLLPAIPLMAVLALAVKLSSAGPVLFRQKRCGRHGKEFNLLKFRTMRDGGHLDGPGVTRRGDPRVTGLGRLLRKWKLDELPQLFNVLCGDLSLVGPRPDLAKYYSVLPQDEQYILLVRPGLTSPATLTFRDEETVLARVAPELIESFYTSSVLPQKVRIDLDYCCRATLLSDMKLLYRTVVVILL